MGASLGHGSLGAWEPGSLGAWEPGKPGSLGAWEAWEPGSLGAWEPGSLWSLWSLGACGAWMQVHRLSAACSCELQCPGDDNKMALVLVDGIGTTPVGICAPGQRGTRTWAPGHELGPSMHKVPARLPAATVVHRAGQHARHHEKRRETFRYLQRETFRYLQRSQQSPPKPQLSERASWGEQQNLQVLHHGHYVRTAVGTTTFLVQGSRCALCSACSACSACTPATFFFHH